MELYKVAFYGDLAPNVDLDTAQNNLATLFKTDIDRIKAMFSGNEIIIKDKIDGAIAEKYRLAMLKAGAVAHVINISTPAVPEVEEISDDNSADDFAKAEREYQTNLSPKNQKQDNSNTNKIRNFIPTKTSDLHKVGVDSSRFAPLHVKPRDEYAKAFVNVNAPDFGITKLGNNLQDQKEAPRAPNFDLSKFSLSPNGANLEQITKHKTIKIPDISHLSMK